MSALSPTPAAPPPGAPPAAELARLADALEGRSPAEIVAAAATHFPRIALATSLGPEDAVLLHLVATENLPVDVFTLDTGFLFAQSYALWTRLEERYGLTIRALKGDAPMTLVPGETPPWVRDPDACCAARKVAPLRAELARHQAWITGIRRDQTPDRASARVVEWDGRFGLVKVNPLAAWTSDEVWSFLRLHDVPVNPLHAEGYASIGCAPCTSPVHPGEDPRAGRWRGREKTECGLHVKDGRLTGAGG
jgi:phosphoadenosine phosphosulfate reductase